MKTSVVVLLVMHSPIPASQGPTPLQRVLASLNVEILRVVTCQQARQLLRTCPPIDLVITDVSLSDGNWRDVLREVVEARIDVNMLLTTASPDAPIWSEALWRGVYDILVEPYGEQEVCRAIEGAVRNKGSAQSAPYGLLPLARTRDKKSRLTDSLLLRS